MADLIKIKRGLKADLPTLKIGEQAHCTDTNELFIGTESGNVLVGGGGGGSSTIAEVTYSELKVLRDSSELVPGTLYKITDYQTVYKFTFQNYQSGPIEPLLVKAIDINKIDYRAYSISKPDNTIYYTIDNDTSKHDWADPTSGKGVIYRRIDSYNNDLCYDFKAIKIFNNTIGGGVTAFYTFDDGTGSDASESGRIMNNTFRGLHYTDTSKLPATIFIVPDNSSVKNNTITGNYAENIIVLPAYNNFLDNFIEVGFYKNNISASFIQNRLGVSFQYNNISASFSYNITGNNFDSNTITGDLTESNFSNYVQNNNFSGGYGNIIGNYVGYNTFSSGFNSNVLGNYIYSITVGTNFKNNSILNNLANIDLSGFTELHGKNYSHIIYSDTISNSASWTWLSSGVQQVGTTVYG